jgi:hypothetical protein
MSSIDHDLPPATTDERRSLGRYLPGKHMPIVDNRRLFAEQPAYVVLLAWHYAEYMVKTLRESGLGSTFVVPLPELTLVSAESRP